MKQSPKANEIEAAWKVLDAFRLHFYQLLWFQQPKLTSPGRPGYPFTVEFADNSGVIPSLDITYSGNHYGRLDTSNLRIFVSYGRMTDDDAIAAVDKEVLEKCKIILERVRDEKTPKVSNSACCILAELRPCVCRISFKCVLHGTKCVGTHD